MHPTSMENMRRCIDWYLPNSYQRVIELGSSDVNGTYKELLAGKADYTGFDLSPGPGVDVVLDTPYRIPLEDASAGAVLSGQMLEHCAHFWLLFAEIARILKPGGLAFMIAPSAGPMHRYPADCYRFYPDAYQALAEWSGMRLVHCWLDERGPWCDLTGVFQKGGGLKAVSEPPHPGKPALFEGWHVDPAAEAMKGNVPYLDVLARLHSLVQPKLYAEIGVRKGNSLRVCSCEMIGIDPGADLKQDFERLTLYPCSSDDFFFFHAAKIIHRPVDLAFIDGMHLIEFVYRDFMNIERFMSPEGVIVIDDVLPNHPVQASRVRQSRVWCGDVWRIVPLLRSMRPDLKLTILDTAPSGLLVISRLDPGNRSLWDKYNPVVRTLMENEPELPQSVLSRDMAVAPGEEAIRAATTR